MSGRLSRVLQVRMDGGPFAPDTVFHAKCLSLSVCLSVLNNPCCCSMPAGHGCFEERGACCCVCIPKSRHCHTCEAFIVIQCLCFCSQTISTLFCFWTNSPFFLTAHVQRAILRNIISCATPGWIIFSKQLQQWW